MATKIYESRISAVSFGICVDGKTVQIRLSGGYCNAYGNRCSYFKTANKKIQDAIEAHPIFGKQGQADVYLARVIGEDTIQDNIDTVTTFEEVTTLKQAQEIMKDEFGKTHSEVISKSKLLAVANALNVKFPNLK